MVADADNRQQEDKIMHRRQHALTLGELIRLVSKYAHTDHEVGLAVADLMQRGVVVNARPAAIRALLRTVGHSQQLINRGR